MKGAPIRFVVAVIGGWTCVRIAVLLPGVEPLKIAGDVLAAPAAATGRTTFEPSPTRRRLLADSASFRPSAPGFVERREWSIAAPTSVISGIRLETDVATSARAPNQQTAPAVLIMPIAGTPPNEPEARCWSVSTWLLARGGASGTLSGGQLGASQAGARILYRVDEHHRIALAARVATPLKGRGTEAAVGVDWQPTAAPVHLVAEQRFGIDGARGGPTLMAIAGVNPTPVAAGFRIEAYAQAGAILRDGKAEAFGDGAARLTRPVASVGDTTFDLGVGAWGAGQHGAARVDLGPSLGLGLPVANGRVRVTLDWRQRVAGRARPGSGPALSIGSDF